MFEQLTHDAQDIDLTAKDLIVGGVGRSTAYAFLRGERKDYKLKTLTTIEHVILRKRGNSND